MNACIERSREGRRKIYISEDLASFEKDNYGRLICPSGDYTNIKSFRSQCVFGEGCSFVNCSTFGWYSSFGKHCSFGDSCSFGQYCFFGEHCTFGEDCSFSDSCLFDKCCSFGARCAFGELCNLYNNLYFENIAEKIDRVLKIDGIGDRKGCIYFFKTVSEIYVRCEYFFGTIDEFRKQVKIIHNGKAQYLLEYTEAIKYAKKILRCEELDNE